ncbi:MAG: YlbF family regulator [Phycisphaerales bacterium]|nr:YlbF family regulator [Phycisphaerales bacterium]
MPDAQDLVQRARGLGEALAAHPVVVAYFGAQHQARSDNSAQSVLRDYQQQLEHIQKLEAEQQPIEVADKHKLQALEQQMASSDALKRLMRAQADYVALMNQVNAAMEEPLARLRQGSPQS